LPADPPSEQAALYVKVERDGCFLPWLVQRALAWSRAHWTEPGLLAKNLIGELAEGRPKEDLGLELSATLPEFDHPALIEVDCQLGWVRVEYMPTGGSMSYTFSSYVELFADELEACYHQRSKGLSAASREELCQRLELSSWPKAAPAVARWALLERTTLARWQIWPARDDEPEPDPPPPRDRKRKARRGRPLKLLQ